jgi:cystathionine beta-lyase/cystathionine gamma-synthase
MHPESRVIHQKTLPPAGTNRPLVPPLYHSVKYTADTFEELMTIFGRDGNYVYSRVSNPTVRQLELLLSELQGKEDCVCVASGVGAITSAFLALLSSGDHVIMGYESYKPTRIFFKKILARFGVTATYVSIKDINAIAQAVIPGKTKVIAFESPTNPVTRIADIGAICTIAKASGILTLMDNTFAGFHNHGQYPVDIFVHSLTKFANGHGDSMGGAILAGGGLIQKIRSTIVDLGPTMDPSCAYLILRGMKTYHLRYERAAANSLELAKRLEAHKKIVKVLYPGLPSHPDHDLAKTQMHEFGTIMAIYLGTDKGGIARYMNRLNLFAITASLGSVESLVAPIDIFYGGDLSAEEKKIALITPDAIRLSIGTEHVDDLFADLTQALDAV